MARICAAGMGVLLLPGCIDRAEAVQPWGPAVQQAVDEAGDGGTLLARARSSLRGGVVAPRLREALRASSAPRHRRATAILDAVDGADPVGPGGAMEPLEPLIRRDRTGRMRAPDATDSARAAQAAGPAAAQPREPALEGPRLAVVTPPPSGPLPPRARASGVRRSGSSPARLQRLGLRSTRGGAALALRGSGGLVVGAAAQPVSGTVRLVMEATASESALRARPRVDGARVTAVRRVGRSVFVTVSVDPGWSLHGIVKTRGGARIDLRRPVG